MHAAAEMAYARTNGEHATVAHRDRFITVMLEELQRNHAAQTRSANEQRLKRSLLAEAHASLAQGEFDANAVYRPRPPDKGSAMPAPARLPPAAASFGTRVHGAARSRMPSATNATSRSSATRAVLTTTLTTTAGSSMASRPTTFDSRPWWRNNMKSGTSSSSRASTCVRQGARWTSTRAPWPHGEAAKCAVLVVASDHQ